MLLVRMHEHPPSAGPVRPIPRLSDEALLAAPRLRRASFRALTLGALLGTAAVLVALRGLMETPQSAAPAPVLELRLQAAPRAATPRRDVDPVAALSAATGRTTDEPPETAPRRTVIAPGGAWPDPTPEATPRRTRSPLILDLPDGPLPERPSRTSPGGPARGAIFDPALRERIDAARAEGRSALAEDEAPAMRFDATGTATVRTDRGCYRVERADPDFGLPDRWYRVAC